MFGGGGAGRFQGGHARRDTVPFVCWNFLCIRVCDETILTSTLTLTLHPLPLDWKRSGTPQHSGSFEGQWSSMGEVQFLSCGAGSGTARGVEWCPESSSKIEGSIVHSVDYIQMQAVQSAGNEGGPRREILVPNKHLNDLRG